MSPSQKASPIQSEMILASTLPLTTRWAGLYPSRLWPAQTRLATVAVTPAAGLVVGAPAFPLPTLHWLAGLGKKFYIYN
jgi:hypothetical protein